MIPYLFRGKRIDNGEWVYGCGSCVKLKSGERIEYITEYGESINDVRFERVEVDTTSTYAGLDDKHGKKVYVGDIVKVTLVANDTQPLQCATVICESVVGDGRYGLRCKRSSISIDTTLNWCIEELEVIGNIHDNPELLEGGATDGK